MLLSYNGVSLEIERILSFEETPVYSADGVDYLYTHVRIVTRSIWNPSATANAGAVAAQSINELRRALVAPRKALLVTIPSGGSSGSKTVIRSPLRKPASTDLYPCDANNGPKPIGVPIIQFMGEKTAIVDFAIETWVNECDTMRPLLSHRWSMSHSVDAEFFTTRTITGTAVFRTDWLNVNSPAAVPDDFRQWLFPVVMDNYQRTLHVDPSSDGTTLQYTVVDVEQRGNIQQGYHKIARYDGTYSVLCGAGSFSFAAGAAGAVEGAILSGGNPFGIAAGFVLGGTTFPKIKLQMNIQLWGRPECTSEDLAKAAAKVLIAFNFVPKGLSSEGGTVTGVLGIFQNTCATMMSMGPRPYIEVIATYESAQPSAAIFALLGIGAAAGLGIDIGVMKPVVSRARGQTSNPNIGGTRGTLNSQASAAPAVAACSAVAEAFTSPTNPSNIIVRNA